MLVWHRLDLSSTQCGRRTIVQYHVIQLLRDITTICKARELFRHLQTLPRCRKQLKLFNFGLGLPVVQYCRTMIARCPPSPRCRSMVIASKVGEAASVLSKFYLTPSYLNECTDTRLQCRQLRKVPRRWSLVMWFLLPSYSQCLIISFNPSL